ncbi:MAG: hypothetical protein KGO82_00520 [Bacteroidota bacterium]|nr:hypothetical protein [Bacteroidota bacterium]
MKSPGVPAMVPILAVIVLHCLACSNSATTKEAAVDSPVRGSYAWDKQFLRQHTGETVELRSADSMSRVLLSAQYQGRVMTSTATGDTGISFGWINYNLIASGEKRRQFNPVGGEERFWMGPEGGQYSIYFKPGDSFNIGHWQVPAFIDTISWKTEKADEESAIFSTDASLQNFSGTPLSVHIERAIHLLSRNSLRGILHSDISNGLSFVGFQTENKVTNTGKDAWKKETGLLSVWLLGMFTPGPETGVVIPFVPGPKSASLITSNYFGTVPPQRLQVTDSIVYFVCDGKYRSKIGISPKIAKPIAAAFDFKKNVLTVVIPEIARDSAYVNSKWEIQKEPYRGDVINSYNDGPLADGSQMGPFFEIESSSPALALPANGTALYRQTTCHFQGDYEKLRALAQQLLGVQLEELRKRLHS